MRLGRRVVTLGAPLLVASAFALSAADASASSCTEWRAANGPEDDCGEPAEGSLACFPVWGWFEASAVFPPVCQSPVGLCTEGDLHGFLRGDYALQLEQILPTGDARIPYMNFFTGTSDVDSEWFGDFVMVDTGAMNMLPPGTLASGEFASHLSVIEGGAGWVKVTGTLDFITGEVSGTYFGTVCPEGW